ncbi:MAG: S49 family peptidase [Rhodocyclaceae bacterium]|jgi:protease-4
MPDTAEHDPAWERRIVEKLALEALAEQRRRRRWGIFFKILGFAYLTFLIAVLGDWGETTEKLSDGKKHTALIELNGVIKATGEASAKQITGALQAAFADSGTQGVILHINSPGGSPVQSGIINDEIRRLRAKHPNVPLYAVVEDVCASGGYYVAAAADRIFVNKASIVGSIGVLMDGFGFNGAMDKLGVERRLLTAGENKGFLDPFSPQDARHKEHAQILLDDIHKQFIDVVRAGRGQRLKETPELFSGLMWTGAKSIELGLADELGGIDYVAREVVKAEVIRDFTKRANLAERFARQFGTDVAEGIWRAAGKIAIR